MFGERLSELRKDKHYTQEELGQMLSVSKYTISSYENEKTSPDDETKVLIAKIFDVSVDYLMGLIDTPVSYERGERVIMLPKSFTEEDIKETKTFVEFKEFRKQKDE